MEEMKAENFSFFFLPTLALTTTIDNRQEWLSCHLIFFKPNRTSSGKKMVTWMLVDKSACPPIPKQRENGDLNAGGQISLSFHKEVIKVATYGVED